MLNKIETVTINRKDLISKLQFIKKLIPTHTAKPDDLLKRSHLCVDSGSLYVIATNSEQTLRVKICDGVNNNLGGNFNPVSVLNFIKKVKKDEIELHFTDEGKLTVTCGKVSFTDKSFDKEMWDKDYGDPEKSKEEITSITIPTNELIKMFSEVQHSISTEETRYYLNGVYMHENDDAGALNFISTNGHILTKRVLSAAYDPANELLRKGVIIPKEAVKYVLDFAKKFSGDLVLKLTESKLVFAFGDLELRTKLVDGTYPDYRRVIPQGANLRISANKNELLEKADIFSIQKSKRGIKFEFDTSTRTLNLERECRDVGAIGVTIPADTDDSELADVAIFGLAGHYLTTIIKSIDSGIIDLKITMCKKKHDDGTHEWQFNEGPVIVKGDNNNHADDLNVIMPARV